MDSLPSEKLLSHYSPLRPVSGCQELTAHQAPDVFALWQAWEEESGGERDIPFWAVVWPGALVLARYLSWGNIRVSNRAVLDLGCGGGIAGIAAARAGARLVIANDIDPVALHLTERNSKANGITLQISGKDLIKENNLNGIDLILVADMFYQLDPAKRLLGFLRQAQQQGTTVLIADGQRPFAPRSGIKVLAEEKVPVNKDLEGTGERRVRLIELT